MTIWRWPRWSRGLAAVVGVAVLAACAPAPPPLYSDTTPPVLMTTPTEAGIVDLRARYRAALCRRLPPKSPRCDDVLLRLPGESDAPSESAAAPEALRRYRLAFIPGLFSECLQAIARPFADVIPDLTRAGADARYFSVAGRGSTATNSARLETEIASLPDDGLPLIVFAYSKGLPDLLELVVRRPESAARIAAIVSLAGAANGSLLADRYVTTYRRWLSGLPLVSCGSGTGDEMGDMRRDVRLEWWRQHRAAISIPIFLLVTTPRRDHVSPTLSPTYRELARTEPRNDGMLFWYDQLVSGASLLGYVNADHWSVAMPLSQELRAVDFLFYDDAVPRTLLVEAAIEVVDEVLRTRDKVGHPPKGGNP
jgi:hypothetical protein